MGSLSVRRRLRAVRTRLAVVAVVLGLAVLALPATPSDAAVPRRPQGPCDIYDAAGTPCVAAHSTTRALYAGYTGPLYQVRRVSDGATTDIGVVAPSTTPVVDRGGYADAARQDAFCAGTTCLISTVYDQSPNHNDLTQAPRGGFSGPAQGGADNLPVADLAPVTVAGHKAYGVFIEPGTGLRDNDTHGIAVEDQSEGMYWVVDGQHFNSGCCYDYGNTEIDSRDDGNGTMETTYFGNATAWYHGNPPGPWVMTDQENNLVGCVNPGSTSKLCPDLDNIDDRFVTAIAKGEPHHWATLAGNAQAGSLTTQFDGPRVDRSYDPMRKQGGIVLGNGGDNSVGSQGTFYEGVMTAGYPSDAVDKAVQANVVTARYGVQPLTLAPAGAVAAPTGVQTFAPGRPGQVTESFTNTTGHRITGVELGLAVPAGWSATVTGASGSTARFSAVKPGASVSATFTVTPGTASFQGDLGGTVSWVEPADGRTSTTTTLEHVRNTLPVRINEIRAGTAADPTDGYLELVNTSAAAVDLSGWTITEHAAQKPVTSAITVPAGTTLAAGARYVLGQTNASLAAPSAARDITVRVSSVTGMSAGDTVVVGVGKGQETRRILEVGTAAGPSTPLWQPEPDGPVTVPAGSTDVPVTSTTGFVVGQRIGLGSGASYDTATVTRVGKPGTQGLLSAPARVGDTTIKMSSTANISVGDRIRLDIDDRIEYVTVAAVGTPGASGTGITVAEPLHEDHVANLPYSVRGTGIGFSPATRHPHVSNEPVQPLGSGISLDRPLTANHAVDSSVYDAKVTTAGYQGSPTPDQWFGGPTISPGAGNVTLRDPAGSVADSVNYGLLVDPWLAEGYQRTSGSGATSCQAPAPGLGRSIGRYPDGTDTDSNCTDFVQTNSATPGAANQPFTLDPGPQISLQAAVPAGSSTFVTHDDNDDLVATTTVTTSSPDSLKQDATFVETAGLADPACFSFESVNRPGQYLRHTGFQFHLQPSDGSTLFGQDATFCQVAGNSGTGVSFASVNFPTKFIRAYQGLVYLASNGGTNAWDTTTNWAADSSWILADPWGPVTG